MRSDTQQAQSPSTPRRSGFGAFVFVCESLSVTAEVFIRRGFGDRYLSRQAAAAILAILVFPAFAGTTDVEALLPFLGFYLFMLFGRRVESVKLRAKGPAPHSRYSGFPVLLYLPLLRRIDEARFKATWEPWIVMFGGVFLMPVSEGLGRFVAVAGIAMAITESLRRAYFEHRARDLRDAYLEQRAMAARFRDLQ